jgi:hypothetical protein
MSIQQQIDDFLRKKNEDRSKRERSGKLSPSTFGKCFRCQYWYYHNETPSNPPDERTMRVFACGDLFHNYVKSFMQADFEVKVEDARIKGYADAVTNDEVYEIKSQHSRAFWYMEKELQTKTIEEIKPENILQGTCYCIMMNKQFLHLVYISKDDLCIKEFKILVNDEMKKNVNNEINTLKNLVDLPSASPRLYGKDKDGNPKECGYCNYKDKCFKLQKEALNG